jgi:hypothetical protein
VEPTPDNSRSTRQQAAKRTKLRQKIQAEAVASQLGLVTSWQAMQRLRPELKNPLAEIQRLQVRYGLRPTAVWRGWRLYRLGDVKAAMAKLRPAQTVRLETWTKRQAEIEAHAVKEGLVTAAKAGKLLQPPRSAQYVNKLRSKGLKEVATYRGRRLYRLEDVVNLVTSKKLSAKLSAEKRRVQAEMIAAEQGLVTLEGIAREFNLSGRRAETWARQAIKSGKLQVEVFKTINMYPRDGVEQLMSSDPPTCPRQ